MQQATTADQRRVAGTLVTLPTLATAHELAAPALIVVGDVVRMRKELNQ